MTLRGLSYPFNPSQAELLSMLGGGKTRPEIEEKLGITQHAVNSRIKRLTKLLGYEGPALVVFAVRWVDLQQEKECHA